MSLLISEIDYNNCSLEELKSEMVRLERIREEYYNKEQSIKIFINSCYGACASPYYECYNINIAEATTLQGQDMIKFTNDVIDDYFLNKWHLDTELHAKLGLTSVRQITSPTTVVYNDTDSIVGNSIIHTNNGKKTIEQWYNDNIINGSGGITENGHESVLTNDVVLNWSKERYLYYGKVKRIIRHKVSKPKWRLRTSTGKKIIMTNDHSMVVFRDNEQLTVKPCEILTTDKVLCLENTVDKFMLCDVFSCMEIGSFNDEYVYDIEMDDATHTFIANGILVHNSTYISFQHAIDSVEGWDKSATEFVLALNEHRMQEYLDECFKDYAEKNNSVNLQKLELEKISHTALMVAKKKYILELSWKEPDVFYKPLEKIKPTGVELVQGQTPKFARVVIKDIINLIFEKNVNLKYMDVVNKLREYKKSFMLQHPEAISKTMSIGNYEKSVENDRDTVSLRQHCPIHVKASAIYNHELLNSKWRTKYDLIKTGDKCKFYYTTYNSNVFGFLPNNYPSEFAHPIDYDTQFDKIIIKPINSYLQTLGMQPIPATLVVPMALF